MFFDILFNMKNFFKKLIAIEMLPMYGLILLLVAVWAIISYAEKNGYLDSVNEINGVRPSEVR